MKKALFYAGYFLLPALPAFLYVTSSGSGLDSYSLSIVLGVYAFSLICGQFLLAARPLWATKMIGPKGLIRLHSILPVFIIAVAAGHSALKEANGFSGENLQGKLGGISFLLFIIVVVFTVLLMANTFLQKIGFLKRFKAWASGRIGLTYKRARALHNVTVAAGVLVLVHVFLASSSDLSANPAGFAILGAMMIGSLSLYAAYRIKGRNAKGK